MLSTVAGNRLGLDLDVDRLPLLDLRPVHGNLDLQLRRVGQRHQRLTGTHELPGHDMHAHDLAIERKPDHRRVHPMFRQSKRRPCRFQTPLGSFDRVCIATTGRRTLLGLSDPEQRLRPFQFQLPHRRVEPDRFRLTRGIRPELHLHGPGDSVGDSDQVDLTDRLQ